jgi:amidohydrolase
MPLFSDVFPFFLREANVIDPVLPVFVLLLLIPFTALFAAEDLDDLIDGEIGSLLSTYKKLHANPELSFCEKKTAAFLAGELRALGCDVTEKVGCYEGRDATCYGVAGVYSNGPGATVLLRTDMDALPIEEKTGLSYSSKVRGAGSDGEETAVMHACGHDIHMASFLGTARLLVRLRKEWSGTVVFVAQPAEEMGAGAKAMLADGLYTRFPRPDFGIAFHDDAGLEAGRVGVRPGYTMASVSSVDVRIRGVGGHGAYPHETIDPIVIAGRVVLDLQTIVSRELSPLEPAVVTVGSIHGGSKHNIIPDEVKLQLTVRAYSEDVRRRILASIGRIAHGAAFAAGVPGDRLPVVALLGDEFTPSTYNDPALAARLAGVWKDALGSDNVVESAPVMAGEDFGRYSLEGHSIPTCLFWVGAVKGEKAAASRESGLPLPGLHSPHFAPDPEPTIRTGVKATVSALLELLKK